MSDFTNPVPKRGPRVISDYDGPGYSQEPGHYPLNAREIPKKRPPTAESLYRNSKNPRRTIYGGY